MNKRRTVSLTLGLLALAAVCLFPVTRYPIVSTTPEGHRIELRTGPYPLWLALREPEEPALRGNVFAAPEVQWLTTLTVAAGVIVACGVALSFGGRPGGQPLGHA